jgi:hypothetical protein
MGISENEVHHLAVGADVERADEDVRSRFDEPTLQVATDGGRDIVADEDSHASEWGWSG